MSALSHSATLHGNAQQRGHARRLTPCCNAQPAEPDPRHQWEREDQAEAEAQAQQAEGAKAAAGGGAAKHKQGTPTAEGKLSLACLVKSDPVLADHCQFALHR